MQPPSPEVLAERLSEVTRRQDRFEDVIVPELFKMGKEQTAIIAATREALTKLDATITAIGKTQCPRPGLCIPLETNLAEIEKEMRALFERAMRESVVRDEGHTAQLQSIKQWRSAHMAATAIVIAVFTYVMIYVIPPIIRKADAHISDQTIHVPRK